MSTRTRLKPGGWKTVKTGKFAGNREIEQTVSKGVFTYTGAALIDRETGIEPGTRVRLTKLYSAPAPGTMGHYYIVEADEPYAFLGMVAYGSLEKERK